MAPLIYKYFIKANGLATLQPSQPILALKWYYTKHTPMIPLPMWRSSP